MVPDVAHGEASPPINAAEAHALTERIRSTTRQICLLLLEAHERRAWMALGYRGWGEYVRSELGLSRSRSYELLDQAHVILAIRVATGTSQVPDISPYAAGQIRPHLSEVTAAIRTRSGDVPRDRVHEVVAEVVHEVRTRTSARQDRSDASAPAALPGRVTSPRLADRSIGDGSAHRSAQAAFDLGRVQAAIRRLASMPPSTNVVARIPDGELPRLARLSQARAWLVEFAARQPVLR